jgi:hypothetical protein
VVPFGGDQIRFVFGRDNFTPKSLLTSEVRTIDGFSFITPSTELIKELFLRKAHSGPYLLDSRIEKLKTDARVIMDDGEFEKFSAFVDSRRKQRD